MNAKYLILLLSLATSFQVESADEVRFRFLDGCVLRTVDTLYENESDHLGARIITSPDRTRFILSVTVGKYVHNIDTMEPGTLPTKATALAAVCCANPVARRKIANLGDVLDDNVYLLVQKEPS